MAEVVKLSQCGLLSPVGDSRAMADNLVKLAENEALCAEFSRRASAAYAKQFTLEHMSAKYLNLYRGHFGEG